LRHKILLIVEETLMNRLCQDFQTAPEQLGLQRPNSETLKSASAVLG
jgi:hypothetical protein